MLFKSFTASYILMYTKHHKFTPKQRYRNVMLGIFRNDVE